MWELHRFDPRVTEDDVVLPKRLLYESTAVQAEMVFDSVRTKAFKNAIGTTAKDKVILDIGTGTGLLSIFAAKAGARKVYAVEASGIIDDAKEIAEENGCAGKIEFVRGYSAQIELPEQCDVLVSEMIGHFGVEEDIAEIFADARKRLLKPSAIIMPANVELSLVPASVPEFQQAINIWHRLDKEFGFDYFEYKARHARKCAYIFEGFKNLPRRFLSVPQSIASLDLYAAESGDFAVEVEYKASRNGTTNGLVGWFCSTLYEGIEICTSPYCPPTHWSQCFFPTKPVKVREGDKLKVKFTYKKPEHETGYRFKAELQRV